MSYDLKKSASGKFVFNLKAANHQVILTSQLYATKRSAEAGIASVQKHGADEKYFELKVAKSKEPYFILKASNGQTIGKSEMYKSEAAAKNGIASVQKNAASTSIKDLV